ncbi:MAG TPA: hypothetical protein VGI30_01215 [Caulobacteraceae bacterium]|jgi:hypothetical protein
MRAPLILAVLVLTAGCQGSSDPGAPAAEGVCWRASPAPPHFVVAAQDVPDLEDCAMDLDLAYLGDGHDLIGAYQGSYIFVGPTGIESAAGLNLFHYPMFTPTQRAALDSQLRVVLAARATRAAIGAPKP